MPLKESTIKESATILTNTVRIKPEAKTKFLAWQAKLNECIAGFPGFVSLEILASGHTKEEEWILVQRFTDNRDLSQWINSHEREELVTELQKLLNNDFSFVREEQSKASDLAAGVTEVFVTQVLSGKEDVYRQWLARIHQVEAHFPGFRGCYVQSPREGQSKNWITLLQFDTPENLDRWLNSEERQKILQESSSLIASLDNQRVISPYAGWFSSIVTKSGKLPAAWKQSMIVLLVLFPIVMFEFKYLSPITKNLNVALGTFIGNAISVALIAWPMTPIAIWLLGWWLLPNKEHATRITVIGTIVVLLLYLAEIILLWNFL